MCLVRIVASSQRTALKDEVLHVVLVDGGRHFLEQVAGVREHAGGVCRAPPDDEPPATGVALRSMGAGAGVEDATTLTSGEHSPERREACGYTWKPGTGLQADARGESGSIIRGNTDEPVLVAATVALRRPC